MGEHGWQAARVDWMYSGRLEAEEGTLLMLDAGARSGGVMSEEGKARRKTMMDTWERSWKHGVDGLATRCEVACVCATMDEWVGCLGSLLLAMVEHLQV